MSTKYDFLLPQNRPTGIGNNLYLLGTSEDGPYMEPMYVRDKAEARKIYGDAFKGTLVKAFDEAYDRNKEVSIYLMRITGETAKLEIWDINRKTGEYSNLITFYSAYAGEKYNQTSLILAYDRETNMNALLLSTSRGLVSYLTPPDMTIGGIVQMINNDCRLGKHKILATTEHYHLKFDSIAHEFIDAVYLTGGKNGLLHTRDEMYLACDIAYSLLLGRQVDVVVPVDMYVDDVHPSYLYGDTMYGSAFYSRNRDYLQLVDTHNNDKAVSYHEQLIDFCRNQVKLGYMTHGVIGIRPFETIPHNISHDNSYIKRLLDVTAFKNRHGFLDYVNGNWYDKGFYISVVCSELIFHKGSEIEYYANGSVRYASIIAGHYDTTTNYSLGNDVELRYELSENTRAGLSTLGVVSFRDSVRLGLVVHSGVTPALPQNDFHNFANVRMVQLTLAYMNSAVEIVYESDLHSGMRRTFLEELVQERLSLLREWKVIDDYNYSIRSRRDGKYGEILLALQTKYSVEALQVSSDILAMEV